MYMNSMFSSIKDSSQKRLDELRTAISTMSFPPSLKEKICIFACGSLGRLEMTEQSDLDLFFISDCDSINDKGQSISNISNLDKYRFFAQLDKINKSLHYIDPSKGGLYWDFTSKRNLLDIGSRVEDYNNSFTARMLLLLESKPLYNSAAYDELVKETVLKYFVDYEDYSDKFYPLFLMNDILRYWYTLTLNYEYRRDASEDVNKKYWKRLKLKYPRLITCFSMLACLYQEKISPEAVIQIVKMTPFERLELLAENNEKLKDVVSRIFTEYESYLELRKQGPEWWDMADHKREAFTRADTFHDIVLHDFMKIISETNPALRSSVDVY